MKAFDGYDKINKSQNQNVIDCNVSKNKMMSKSKNNFNDNDNCIYYDNIHNKKD